MSVQQPLEQEINEFNEQFDYGEYHYDHDFWISMLEHQALEMRHAIESGDESHARKEAADAVLVAFQYMLTFGDQWSPRDYIMDRIRNANQRGIEEDIVPKYIKWYEAGGDG